MRSRNLIITIFCSFVPAVILLSAVSHGGPEITDISVIENTWYSGTWRDRVDLTFVSTQKMSVRAWERYSLSSGSWNGGCLPESNLYYNIVQSGTNILTTYWPTSAPAASRFYLLTNYGELDETQESLDALTGTLHSYWEAYGVFPPVEPGVCTVHSGCQVCYQYEDTNTQSSFVIAKLYDDPALGNLFDMGLISYLWPRARSGIAHTANPEYVADTSADLAIKASWSDTLDALDALGARRYFSVSNILAGGGETWYANRVESLQDAWGNPYRYICDPPYQAYSLFSVGPDGMASTADDISVADPSVLCISTSHYVSAQQSALAGLSNAITDLDDLLSSAGKPIIYPEWNIAASTGAASRADHVVSGMSVGHIPTPMRMSALSADASWQTTAPVGNLANRYAYTVINRSGCLDANLVGGSIRLSGTDPAEIQIDNLPDISDPSLFLAARAAQGRYATYRALVASNPAVSSACSSLYVNSYAIVGERGDVNGVAGEQAYVGSNMSLWNTAEIKAAFSQAGVPDPDLAYLNLLDYTDSDSVPQSLSAGCVEKVPMLNEFDFIYQITFDAGGNISGNAGLIMEWVYPFVTASGESFNMFYDIDITSKAGNTTAAALPAGLSGSGTNSNFTGGNVAPMTFGTANKMVALAGAATNTTINVEFDVKVSAYIEGPGGRVDEVPSPYNAANGLQMTVSIPSLARGSTVMVTNSWECLDPRFNWVTDGSQPQWFSSIMLAAVPGFQITPGSENKVTDLYFDPTTYGMPDSFDLDDDMYMYVADRPMKTVAELGYICYDWWRTIRLYEHQMIPNPYPEPEKFHKVLDYFTISTNSYERGLVNVNTTNLSVLASVFYRMPEEEYSTNRLVTWATAQQIAAEIIANGPYTNLCELGKAAIDWGALTSGPTEICKESGIRNAVGLLTTRQNLFTIMVRAEAMALAQGGNMAKSQSLAPAYLTADVWRDPWPDTNGNHACYTNYMTDMTSNPVAKGIIDYFNRDYSWTDNFTWWGPSWAPPTTFDASRGITFDTFGELFHAPVVPSTLYRMTYYKEPGASAGLFRSIQVCPHGGEFGVSNTVFLATEGIDDATFGSLISIDPSTNSTLSETISPIGYRTF